MPEAGIFYANESGTAEVRLSSLLGNRSGEGRFAFQASRNIFERSEQAC